MLDRVNTYNTIEFGHVGHVQQEASSTVDRVNTIAKEASHPSPTLATMHGPAEFWSPNSSEFTPSQPNSEFTKNHLESEHRRV